MNASTFALLAAILLVTASTELWSPLIPQYLKALQSGALAGDTKLILLIGAYGFYRDLLEAVNYYAGGAIAGRFNTRRALLAFNVVPLIGLAILLIWQSPLAVFVAVPFIFVWDSIAGPATITVVGDSLPPDRRTMAFSLQSIARRASRIVSYLVSGVLVWWFGRIGGVRFDVALAAGLVVLAVVIQYRYMKTTSSDVAAALDHPIELFRKFPPNLKRLLVADIASRWAEGLAGYFIIIYCVPILSNNLDAGTSTYQSVLLTIQAATNIVLYILIGPLASKAGLAKKPFIGLTFIFFALFPISLAILGRSFGIIGLMIAFFIGGLREIGEPARKAMIADLVPPGLKTQAVGLYWSARGFAVMLASPFGALLWIAGEHFRPGAGPMLTFSAAGAVGLVGAAIFYSKFGREDAVAMPGASS
jgi:MFS family permease